MVRVCSPSESAGAGGSASGHRPDDAAPYEPVPDGARCEPVPDAGPSGTAGYDPVPAGGGTTPCRSPCSARCVPWPSERNGRRARVGHRTVGSRAQPRDRARVPRPGFGRAPDGLGHRAGAPRRWCGVARRLGADGHGRRLRPGMQRVVAGRADGRGRRVAGHPVLTAVPGVLGEGVLARPLVTRERPGVGGVRARVGLARVLLPGELRAGGVAGERRRRGGLPRLRRARPHHTGLHQRGADRSPRPRAGPAPARRPRGRSRRRRRRHAAGAARRWWWRRRRGRGRARPPSAARPSPRAGRRRAAAAG